MIKSSPGPSPTGSDKSHLDKSLEISRKELYLESQALNFSSDFIKFYLSVSRPDISHDLYVEQTDEVHIQV